MDRAGPCVWPLCGLGFLTTWQLGSQRNIPKASVPETKAAPSNPLFHLWMTGESLRPPEQGQRQGQEIRHLFLRELDKVTLQ